MGGKPTMPSTVETLKGTNAALKGKIFTLGAKKASQYNETYKSLLVYIADKFDHRVHTAIKARTRKRGWNSSPGHRLPQRRTQAIKRRHFLTGNTKNVSSTKLRSRSMSTGKTNWKTISNKSLTLCTDNVIPVCNRSSNQMTISKISRTMRTQSSYWK